jgi:hypothetical protein
MSSLQNYAQRRDRIPDKAVELRDVVKIISHGKPTPPKQVQLIRKIVFEKSRRGRSPLRQTVTGSSSKADVEIIENLEAQAMGKTADHNTAFSSAMVQINFSWERFAEVDRAFMWFEEIESSDKALDR